MRKTLRILWLAAGYLLLLLGLIGALLPVMPTTIFLILALGCFSRGNPELSRKLLEHPRFGPPLRLWQQHRAMTRRSKLIAITTLTLSLGFSSYHVFFSYPVPGIALAAFGCALIIWMIRLPSPPAESTPCATIKEGPTPQDRQHGSQPDQRQQL